MLGGNPLPSSKLRCRPKGQVICKAAKAACSIFARETRIVAYDSAWFETSNIEAKQILQRILSCRIKQSFDTCLCCGRLASLMPDFQHSVSVAVKPLPYRFRKNRVRTSRSCRCCWGLCAVIARQAQDAGRRAREKRNRVGGAAGAYERQIRKNRTRSYMNGLYGHGFYGNGELTETENVIFYVSYRVLTEFLRMNVILTYFCNGQKAIRERRNGYVKMETAHHNCWPRRVVSCQVWAPSMQSITSVWITIRRWLHK